MNIRSIKNSARRLKLIFLYIACTLSFVGCTKKERYEKEIYNQDLKMFSLGSGDYKKCTAFAKTVLIPKKKITGRFSRDSSYFLPEEIVKGNNLIAVYYYSNNLDLDCGVIDGWFNEEIYFEFENFRPEIGKQYSLPQKQVKIFYRSENSDMPTVYDHNNLTGKIIFQEFSDEKIKFSIFLEPLYYANNPERRGKYPVLNFSELEFKAFTEKFYEDDDYEALVKRAQ